MTRIHDVALAESVREHLMSDTRLASQSLEVIACNGDIQIIGVIDTEEHHQLALQLARGVSGVRYIDDHLIVQKKPPERTV